MSTAIDLGTKPGIGTVGELKNRLAKALDQQAPVVLDVSAVDSVDTATLQLLAAFATQVRRKKNTLQWRDPSPVFVAAADILGLTAAIGLEYAEDAPDEDDGLCPVF